MSLKLNKILIILISITRMQKETIYFSNINLAIGPFPPTILRYVCLLQRFY